RGSFRYCSDGYSFGVRDSEINPFFDARGGYEGKSAPFPQFIVVDKPLTIRGENSADSKNPTIITVANTWLKTGTQTHTGYNNGMGGLYTDSNLFVLASSDITIKNLRFHNMIQGIEIISAGTTIEDCVWEDAGLWPLNYKIEDYSVYPNYPSYKNPVKSYLRRNQFINVPSAVHLFGSEITITENYFEIRLNILDWPALTSSMWGIVFGGLLDYDYIPNVYKNSLCRNNLVENNVFEGDENSWYGAFYFAGYGAPIIENKISHNTVRNMWAMIESWGGAPVERNTITNNVAVNVGHGFLGIPYYSGYGIYLDSAHPRGCIPTRNVISGNQFIDTLYPMTLFSGEHNQIIDNDYTGTNAPGWFYWQGCVFLGGTTHGNFVSEGLFPPGTTMYEQILDLGTNAIPGSGVFNNNPELAQHLQDAHATQREMKGF
ncbi:unnamed protein product, partial [marine sediment metagenome]